MFSLFSGAIVLGGSTTGLWYFLPQDGEPHPLAKKPLLDSVIPICIVMGLAIGAALIVNALVELAS